MKNILLTKIASALILLAPYCCTFLSNAQIITTIAGNGGDIYSVDGVPATAAGMIPNSVAVDLSGNVLIAGPCNISKIDNSGIIHYIASSCGYGGDGGPASAAMISPVFLAFDGTGNLYFPDAANCVRVINTADTISTCVDKSRSYGYTGNNGFAVYASLKRPIGVACDKSGNLYIADMENNVVRKVSAGIITTFAGGGTGGDGIPATASAIYKPISLTFDTLGNLYIGNYTVLRKVNTSGIISTIAGPGTPGIVGDGGPATAASFGYIDAIAIDRFLNIYICDQTHQEIRVINGSGIISAYAGNGTIGFSGDGGPANLAQLNYPSCIALDNEDNLYIADGDNFRIRKVTASTAIKNITQTTTPINSYPNPTTGHFAITLPQTNEPKTIIIYNMLGQAIASRTVSGSGPQQFNLSGCPGTYIAEVISGSNVYRQQVVVW